MFSENQVELLKSRGLNIVCQVAYLQLKSKHFSYVAIRPTSTGFAIDNRGKTKYVKTFYNVLDEIDRVK